MALLLAIATFLIVACVFFVIWLTAVGGAKQDIVRKRLEAVLEVERRGNVSPEVQIVQPFAGNDLQRRFSRGFRDSGRTQNLEDLCLRRFHGRCDLPHRLPFPPQFQHPPCVDLRDGAASRLPLAFARRSPA